ncbi:MAG: protein-disulfide reductase DsbD family protein, partial [Sphingobacteriia bacterium]
QRTRQSSQTPKALAQRRHLRKGQLGPLQRMRLQNTSLQAPWHIYSVKRYKPGEFGPMPAEYEPFEDSKGVSAMGSLQESGQPTKEYDEVFEVDTWYFTGQAHYYQQFRITAEQVHIKGRIKTQVCKEGICVPKNREIDIKQTAGAGTGAAPSPVSPTEKNTDGESADAAQTQASEADSAQKASEPTATPDRSGLIVVDEQADPNAAADGGSLWAIFFASLAAGLVALITPCVFPLVPMTVSYFTKHAKSRRQGLRDAGVYVLSIIIMFMIPGILLVNLYGGTIFYDISTSGTVNLIFFVVILLFALSFLGWFDIKLPSSWSTWADKRSMKNSGAIGIFFMAMTLVIASFSCTGPLLGGVLATLSSGAGGTQEAVVGLGGFALGFAVPFGILAIFPGLLSGLPSSGGWLNTVKVLLGYIELMLCMKFFSQADQVWHWGILDREVFIAIWIVLSGALGAYLMGWYRLPHDHEPLEKVPVPRLLIALAAFGFGLTMVPGLWGAPIANLSGILPPTNREVGVKISEYYADEYRNHGGSTGGQSGANQQVCDLPRIGGDKHAHNAPAGFCMFYDFEEGMAYASKVGKPVFLDFTGFTCANCRLMESKVWQDPQVKRALQEDYVMISLYVDDTEKLSQPRKAKDGTSVRTIGDKWTQFQIENYGLLAQPYYALIAPELKAGKIVNFTHPVGYENDKNTYLAWLQKGKALYEKMEKK